PDKDKSAEGLHCQQEKEQDTPAVPSSTLSRVQHGFLCVQDPIQDKESSGVGSKLSKRIGVPGKVHEDEGENKSGDGDNDNDTLIVSVDGCLTGTLAAMKICGSNKNKEELTTTTTAKMTGCYFDACHVEMDTDALASTSASTLGLAGMLDEFLLRALKKRQDRLFLLKLDRELCSFIENT
ncbi:hypothetical protein BGZ54_004249, partial [Gamsiella multidivaricata]